MTAPTMISAFRFGEHLAVRLRAPAALTEASPALNLAILLDVSDSMSGDRLTTVKRTLHAARDLFKPTDRVTLVTFGEAAATITNKLLMDTDGIRTFYEAVDAICTSGCTNLSAGIEQLLTLRDADAPFSTTLLLTDGHVNRGVMSTVGLRTMALGIGEIPFNVFGYGADHNRVLSRELAITSRGTYTYIDGDEILPIAVGDIMSGLRIEVLKRASIRVSGRWECMELSTTGAIHLVGGIAPDRDYWVVYRRAGVDSDDDPITVTMTAVGVEQTLTGVLITDCHDLKEQVLRCRLAKALSEASDAIEQGRLIGGDISALHADFEALPDELKTRPLIVRMRGQIAEIMEQIAAAPPLPPAAGAGPSSLLPPGPPTWGLPRQAAMGGGMSSHLAARMSSGTAYLSTQRGVMSLAPEDPDDGEPAAAMFSSPLQRMSSEQVRSAYTGTPAIGAPIPSPTGSPQLQAQIAPATAWPAATVLAAATGVQPETELSHVEPTPVVSSSA